MRKSSLRLHFAGFYCLLKSWGMDPGLEFKVAMEEAERLRAALVYGDADQDHTIRRISASLSAQVLSISLMLCRQHSQPQNLSLESVLREHTA